MAMFRGGSIASWDWPKFDYLGCNQLSSFLLAVSIKWVSHVCLLENWVNFNIFCLAEIFRHYKFPSLVKFPFYILTFPLWNKIWPINKAQNIKILNPPGGNFTTTLTLVFLYSKIRLMMGENWHFHMWKIFDRNFQ